MIIKNIDELKNYLSLYKNATGYCKYLSKKDFDFFENQVIKIDDEPYEIAFKDGFVSITVRYINGIWYVDEVNLKDKNIQTKVFWGVDDRKVLLAQIWEDEELYEGIKTEKLKKVVFYGFEGGGND